LFYFEFISLCTVSDFFSFDVKIRQQIKISKNYLLDSEKQLSQLVSNPKIRLFRQSDLIMHFNRRFFRVTYANLIGGAFHIVGQDVQGHFGAYVLERFHLEVR